MIRYIKMKLFYFQLKKTIFDLFNDNGDFIVVGQKFLEGCKNKTPDEIYKDVIKELACVVHEQADKNRDKENSND